MRRVRSHTNGQGLECFRSLKWKPPTRPQVWERRGMNSPEAPLGTAPLPCKTWSRGTLADVPPFERLPPSSSQPRRPANCFRVTYPSTRSSVPGCTLGLRRNLGKGSPRAVGCPRLHPGLWVLRSLHGAPWGKKERHPGRWCHWAGRTHKDIFICPDQLSAFNSSLSTHRHSHPIQWPPHPRSPPPSLPNSWLTLRGLGCSYAPTHP